MKRSDEFGLWMRDFQWILWPKFVSCYASFYVRKILLSQIDYATANNVISSSKHLQSTSEFKWKLTLGSLEWKSFRGSQDAIFCLVEQVECSIWVEGFHITYYVDIRLYNERLPRRWIHRKYFRHFKSGNFEQRNYSANFSLLCILLWVLQKSCFLPGINKLLNIKVWLFQSASVTRRILLLPEV